MPSTIHHEIVLSASPARVYQALTDAKSFSDMTGAPAEIGSEAGAPFSNFGGMITGRHIELVPKERIVQAWRSSGWAAGEYSIVRYELRPEGTGTRIVFDHSGYPPHEHDHLSAGWQQHYWSRLPNHLA